MQVTTIVVAAIAITVVIGQQHGFGFTSGFAGNGGIGSSFFPGIPRYPGPISQENEDEPNVVSCITGHRGNSLEVYIRESSRRQFNNPFFSQFQGRSSPYEIEVKIDSIDLDGAFTVAITDLSTDNPLCSAEELGSIATSGRPNNGFLSLFTGRLNQDSAGVIGDIDVVAGTVNEEYYRSNTLFSSFRDFRGMGVGICSSVEGGDNSDFHPFFQLPISPARQTCEKPVICCKLGLSRIVSNGK